MSELQNKKIELLNLKQKLEYHLEKFVSLSHIPNSIFFYFLEELKKKYDTDHVSIEFINRINNNLYLVTDKVNEFMINISICNLNNKDLIQDLLDHTMI